VEDGSFLAEACADLHPLLVRQVVVQPVVGERHPRRESGATQVLGAIPGIEPHEGEEPAARGLQVWALARDPVGQGQPREHLAVAAVVIDGARAVGGQADAEVLVGFPLGHRPSLAVRRLAETSELGQPLGGEEQPRPAPLGQQVTRNVIDLPAQGSGHDQHQRQGGQRPSVTPADRSHAGAARSSQACQY
jgi:hypothetical protein